LIAPGASPAGLLFGLANTDLWIEVEQDLTVGV
jgi:hypothetical protein